MGCNASAEVLEGEPCQHQTFIQPTRLQEAPQPIHQHPEEEIPQSNLELGAAKLSEQEQQTLKKAQQHYKHSQYKQAISLCNQLIFKNPLNHQAFHQLGLCYYYQSQYKESVENYKKALEIKSGKDQYWYGLGKAYYFLQDYKQSITAYLTAIEIRSNIAYYYFDLGRAYYYNLQYHEAIKTYEKGQKLDTNNENFNHQIGLCLYYLQQYDKAIEQFNKVLQLKPSNHASLNHIGLCYYYKEDYKEAEKLYYKALELSNNNLSYLWNIGRNYYWMQSYQKAIEIYEQCINLCPKDSSYDAEISICYFHLGDYWAAMEWIEKAIAKDSKKSINLYRKGYIYYHLEEYEESLKWYYKCLELSSDHFKAHLGIANDYYYLQNYPEAIIWYQKCCKLNDKNGQVLERLAKSYYCNGNYQQSLKYFDECIALRPTYIEPLILKGRSLFNLQRYQQSLKEFKKAKELAVSVKEKQPDNYVFYINTINQEIEAGEQFTVKAKIGVITKEDREDVERMRKSFENKIEKLFTFKLKDETDKKSKAEKRVNKINQNIINIAIDLAKQEELYNFGNLEVLKNICKQVRALFEKDYGYFQIFAFIFSVFVWINKFKKSSKIIRIEELLTEKIQYLSSRNPPTQPHSEAFEEIDFPLFPKKKYNLFKDKKYFQSYAALIKEIEKVNELARQDLVPFKQLLFKIQKTANGIHAKANMKLPSRQESKDDVQYQQKLFKVLLRIFQKMFKDELQDKKQSMLLQIEDEVNKLQKIPIQQIIIIMMSKWVGYIDEGLKERSENKVPTECYITDLVRGKCMFKSVGQIKEAVCAVIKICTQKSYQITELDNRLQKQTQDVVLKIKIKNCVSELQLALEFDPNNFEFGHSFYEIERCTLGSIFGCSLFLAKEVNQTFPELLLQNLHAVKNSKKWAKSAESALSFVKNELMQSVSAIGI